MLSSEARRKAADAVSLEMFITLNDSAAKQWRTQAEMATSSEVKRLLMDTAGHEQTVVTDLRKLLPKVTG